MDREQATALCQLRDILERSTPGEGDHETAIASLHLTRYSSSGTHLCGVLSPALCIAVQGEKEIVLGEEVFSYGPGYQIVSSFELPTSARVMNATSARPYLGLRWHFDPAAIGPMIEEGGLSVASSEPSRRGLYLAPTPPLLIDAVLRLARLLERPREIPVLAPMIEREILFRLLLDRSSAVLHRMAQADSPSHRVATAIAWLRRNYRRPMRVDSLARHSRMSTSGFHRWFRDITGMTPLQYQKQLRLQEARTILRNEHVDVGTVSQRVGYESQSQFSREYKRLFRTAPAREIRAGSLDT